MYMLIVINYCSKHYHFLTKHTMSNKVHNNKYDIELKISHSFIQEIAITDNQTKEIEFLNNG